MHMPLDQLMHSAPAPIPTTLLRCAVAGIRMQAFQRNTATVTLNATFEAQAPCNTVGLNSENSAAPGSGPGPSLARAGGVHVYEEPVTQNPEYTYSTASPGVHGAPSVVASAHVYAEVIPREVEPELDGDGYVSHADVTGDATGNCKPLLRDRDCSGPAAVYAAVASRPTRLRAATAAATNQCAHISRDGQRCGAWAVVASGAGRCTRHTCSQPGCGAPVVSGTPLALSCDWDGVLLAGS